MWRYLNMFVLIGVALILISIIGFANSKFLTEPGQAPNPSAALIYLGAGVLMLINGFVSIRFAPPPVAKQKKIERSDEPAEKVDASTVRS